MHLIICGLCTCTILTLICASCNRLDLCESMQSPYHYIHCRLSGKSSVKHWKLCPKSWKFYSHWGRVWKYLLIVPVQSMLTLVGHVGSENESWRTKSVLIRHQLRMMVLHYNSNSRQSLRRKYSVLNVC